MCLWLANHNPFSRLLKYLHVFVAGKPQPFFETPFEVTKNFVDRIHMLLLRIMHISAYYSHIMTNIRSSMTEIDQSVHQPLILLFVYWIITFLTQLVVLFYWSGGHLAPYHSCFSK